jgi:hypothetical protein
MMKLLRHTLLTGFAVGVLTLVGLSGAALATPSPNGPGQPGAQPGGGTTCGTPLLTNITPGGASTANGSPFNSAGQAGKVYAGNPGTPSLANGNVAHAISQYDIACFQNTSNPGHS